jgi:hypothetical protein
MNRLAFLKLNMPLVLAYLLVPPRQRPEAELDCGSPSFFFEDDGREETPEM